MTERLADQAASTPAAAAKPLSPSNQITGSRRVWALAGVMVVQFTSVLASTIVANSAPTIVDDLHGLNLYAWVFAGYSAAATVCVPVVGKLSDLLGRRVFVLGSLLVFLLGTSACAAAQNMPELIAARVISGCGGGAMLSLSGALVGDIFPPRDRARWMGLLMANFGIGSMLGPIAGGVITDFLGWRWVFLLILPPVALSLALMSVVLPRFARPSRVVIDWLGVGLLSIGIVAVLFALTVGGVSYPWTSPLVIGPLVLGVLVLAIFALHERRAMEPVFNPELLRNPAFAVPVSISFILRLVFYGSLTFLPVYLQGVLGASARDAGLQLVPIMVTFIAGNVISGQLISRSGRYKRVATIGLSIIVAGLLLCSLLSASSPYAQVAAGMALIGFGVGCIFPLTSTVVQSAYPYRILGTVNSARQFFDNLGIVVGIAVMTTLTVDGFTHELPRRVPQAAAPAFRSLGRGQLQGLLSEAGQRSLVDSLAGLPADVIRQTVQGMHQSLAFGLQRAFLFALLAAVGAVLLSLVLPEIPLRASHDA